MEYEDVKKAINIRHNLKWIECDSIIREAQPIVAAALEQLRKKAADDEQARSNFNALAALFTAPLRVTRHHSGDGYELRGLSENQVRLIAKLLGKAGL